MNVVLKIVEIDKFRIILRILNISLFFIILPYVWKISYLDKINFWGYWRLFWTGMLIFQFYLMRPYRKIGQIIFNSDKIVIKKINEKEMSFNLSDKFNIFLKYRGTERDWNSISFPRFYTILSIGTLEIKNNNNNLKVSFISEQDNFRFLEEIFNLYKKMGNVVKFTKLKFY